jgi:hypothetical protein
MSDPMKKPTIEVASISQAFKNTPFEKVEKCPVRLSEKLGEIEDAPISRPLKKLALSKVGKSALSDPIKKWRHPLKKFPSKSYRPGFHSPGTFPSLLHGI